MLTYEELLVETAPAVIENDEAYEPIVRRLSRLVGKGRGRTPEETKLMRLLSLVVEDYDRRHAMPPDESTPAERLQFLMEHSNKTSADLLPVFRTRSHVSEALKGKRAISADQARRLGRIFRVNAGVFV